MRKSLLLSLGVCAVALTTHVPSLLRVAPEAWGGLETERVAVSLCQGRGFADAFYEGSGPTAHVAPLYPLVQAGLYSIAGTYHSPTGRLAQQWLTLALAIAVALLLPATARKLKISENVGWAAAFLFAWLPGKRYLEVTGHQEYVPASLALLGLCWTCATLQDQAFANRRTALVAGLFIGLVALLSPSLLVVPALFVLLEFRRGVRRDVVASCAIMAVGSLLVVAPWAIRNHLVFGGFVPLRSNVGLELAVGNRDGADGHTYAQGFEAIHPYLDNPGRAQFRLLGERAFAAEKQREALAWIGRHPGEFGRLTLRRIFLYWFGPDERWYEPSRRLILDARIHALLGFLLLVELVRLTLTRPATARIVFAATVGAGIPYFFTHVEVRYRYPLIAVSTLAACNLGAAAVAWAFAKWRPKPQTATPASPSVRSRAA